MEQPGILAGLQLSLNLLHPGFTGKNGGKHFPDLLLHGDFAVGKADLVQKADALLSGHGNAAFLVAVQIVHMNISVNQFQQSGLAAAVPPYYRDFLIVADFKIYIFQYGICAVLYQRMSDLISHEVLPSPNIIYGSFGSPLLSLLLLLLQKRFQFPVGNLRVSVSLTIQLLQLLRILLHPTYTAGLPGADHKHFPAFAQPLNVRKLLTLCRQFRHLGITPVPQARQQTHKPSRLLPHKTGLLCHDNYILAVPVHYGFPYGNGVA